jgi:hypothetical protein
MDDNNIILLFCLCLWVEDRYLQSDEFRFNTVFEEYGLKPDKTKVWLLDLDLVLPMFDSVSYNILSHVLRQSFDFSKSQFLYPQNENNMVMLQGCDKN